MHYALRVKKQLSTWSDVLPLEFQFLWPRGCLTYPFRTLSLCFGVIGKTPGLIFHNNFVKKFLYASAIAIMSWQDVTWSSPLLRGQGVWNKTCTQLFLLQFLFQNLKNYSLGVFRDSANILDMIQWSFFTKSAAAAMFYFSLSRFWMATSLISSTSSLLYRNQE